MISIESFIRFKYLIHRLPHDLFQHDVGTESVDLPYIYIDFGLGIAINVRVGEMYFIK